MIVLSVLVSLSKASAFPRGRKQATNVNFNHSAVETAFLYLAMFSLSVWLGRWILSFTLLWWWQKLKKIFVFGGDRGCYRENYKTTTMYQNTTTGFQKDVPVRAMDTSQNVTTITYARFRVTTCLYPSPNNRARSRSTLIAVTVNRNTANRITLITEPVTAR